MERTVKPLAESSGKGRFPGTGPAGYADDYCVIDHKKPPFTRNNQNPHKTNKKTPCFIIKQDAERAVPPEFVKALASTLLTDKNPLSL